MGLLTTHKLISRSEKETLIKGIPDWIKIACERTSKIEAWQIKRFEVEYTSKDTDVDCDECNTSENELFIDEYSMTMYGDRNDEIDKAINDFGWHEDDARVSKFSESPYSVMLYYTINKDGSKYIKRIEVDSDEFIRK